MTHRLLLLYLHICMLAIAGVVAITTYWRFFPVTVIEFDRGSNIELLGDGRYMPGEVLAYRTSGTVHVGGVRAEQTRQLIDGIIYQLAPLKFQTVAGPFDATNVSVTIPVNTPPGKYRLRLTNEYFINPLRTETVVRTSPEFEVFRNQGAAP